MKLCAVEMSIAVLGNDLNATPPQGGWGGQVTLGWMRISSGRSSHVQISSP